MQRARGLVLDGWPLLLAVVLTWPLLTGSGHPLARDLVFVPDQPLTYATLGLGAPAPRAVPLDTVVALLDSVVDGGVLAKVVLPLVLALAGWGVHRAVAGLGTPARLVAGGFAVWNPFVVERLALGQWALLAAYAALPWLAMAVTRWRRERRRVDLAAIVLWSALASITPTGGLLAALVVFGFGRGWRLLGLVAVLQLPWVLPSLVGSGSLTSDPEGIAAFAARGEGPGGPLAAVLGLGGIWDGLSVPGSRETWWGTLAAIVSVAVVVVGFPVLRRLWGSAAATALVVAGVGLALALLSRTPPGEELLEQLVAMVPGAGLLRDSQKYAAVWALLVACGLGASADRALGLARRAGGEVALAATVLLIAVPVVLLPDATRATWPTVTPADWPTSVTGLDAALDEAGATGPVATLPWRAYRRFDWGSEVTASDPLLRLLDRPVIVRDDLVVGDVEVRGESAPAARITALLGQVSPAEALTDAGIRWVVVWQNDPETDGLDLTGLEPVISSAELVVYEVVDAEPRQDGVDPTTRSVVVAGNLLAALLVVLMAVYRVVGSPRFHRGVHGRGRTT